MCLKDPLWRNIGLVMCGGKMLLLNFMENKCSGKKSNIYRWNIFTKCHTLEIFCKGQSSFLFRPITIELLLNFYDTLNICTFTHQSCFMVWEHVLVRVTSWSSWKHAHISTSTCEKMTHSDVFTSSSWKRLLTEAPKCVLVQKGRFLTKLSSLKCFTRDYSYTQTYIC